MTTWVVVNPRAGASSAARTAPQLAQALERADVEYHLEHTRGPNDATRIAREARDAGADCVLVLGGDGTINEVSQAYLDAEGRPLPGPDLALAPGGTGGDFRKTFGFGDDLTETVRRVTHAKTRPLDLGILKLVSNDGEPITRAFINIASFGIGGLVDQLVNRNPKWLGGKATFLLGGLRAWTVYKNAPVTIRVDGKPWLQSLVFQVALANGRYHGGGMMIAPHADPSDGKLDVVALGDLSAIQGATAITKTYQGKHLKDPGVRTTRGTRIEAEPIHPRYEVLIDLDGETPGRLPLSAEIAPGVVRLRV